MSHRLLAAAAAAACCALFATPRNARAQDSTAKGPDTVVYNSTRGTVVFTHAKHAQMGECGTCHHASRAEKPLAKPNQACGDCHTAEAAPPMKTNLRFAFHNTMAKTGVCLDCHNKEAAAGKSVPTNCNDCHKRAGS